MAVRAALADIKMVMTDKLTIENPLDWRSRALLAESEEERLRAECDKLNAYAHKIEEEARQLAFENERLRAALNT